MHFLNAANMYVGDGPKEEASKHLELTEVKLPKMKEKTQGHDPAGGIGEMNMGTGKLEALTLGFNYQGTDPYTLVRMGLDSGEYEDYTIYRSLTDHRTNTKVDAVSRVYGRMTSTEETNTKSGEHGESDYEIEQIRFYSLHIGGIQIYKYDFMTATWEVAGKDIRAPINQHLRI